MHIGGLAVLEGAAAAACELLDHIGTRLHLVPRYRQKLAEAPLRLGRQRWIDDPCFNLEYHVRHTALPAPGDERAACAGWPRASSPSAWTAPSRCGSCGWSRASRTTASR